MSGFYPSLQSGAKKTIDALQSGTIQIARSTAAPNDPAAGFVEPTVEQDVYEAGAVVTGCEAEYVDGELVQADDLQIIMSPFAVKLPGTTLQAFEPKITDDFIIDGKVHRCNKIERVPNNGTAVVFMIFVKS